MPKDFTENAQVNYPPADVCPERTWQKIAFANASREGSDYPSPVGEKAPARRPGNRRAYTFR